ncbi:MAG: hypothetical protein AB7K64_08555 [Variibacter sp.]
MFWPFKKRGHAVMEFHDSEALFRLQCKYGDTRIEKGKAIFSVVVDAHQQFGASNAVKENEDGTQTAVLRVASEDGGFIVLACTRVPHKPLLASGDPVLWIPSTYDQNVAIQLGDERSGWVGFVGAKVSMSIGTSGSFEIIERYG